MNSGLLLSQQIVCHSHMTLIPKVGPAPLPSSIAPLHARSHTHTSVSASQPGLFLSVHLPPSHTHGRTHQYSPFTHRSQQHFQLTTRAQGRYNLSRSLHLNLSLSDSSLIIILLIVCLLPSPWHKYLVTPIKPTPAMYVSRLRQTSPPGYLRELRRPPLCLKKQKKKKKGSCWLMWLLWWEIKRRRARVKQGRRACWHRAGSHLNSNKPPRPRMHRRGPQCQENRILRGL